MTNAQLFADVSDYNGTVDWPAYHRAGHRSGACKATEGVTFKASSFVRNWQGMEAAGIEIRIAYHFAHPSSNPPETEAREFLRTVFAAGARSTDLTCLDIEASPRASQALTRAWVMRFCQFVAMHWGRGPIIYSGGWWWKPYIGSWFPEPGFICPGYWHSAYGSSDQANLIHPHGRYLIHQFTDGRYGPEPHALAGVGQCDVDRWREPFDDIRTLARGTASYRERFVDRRASWREHLARPRGAGGG